jgi:membrane fusion protein, multidrug efflux system
VATLATPPGATGNFTKIVRRFTVRIRLNAREPNAQLERPGMSVEKAIAVSGRESRHSPLKSAR